MAEARAVVVAGATGLVGRAVLAGLLTAEPPGGPATVHVLYGAGRVPPAASHPRMHLHAVRFDALPELPAVEAVYIALGTTLRSAGSRQAFRNVDQDAVLATATAAYRAGARRCGVVSAIGAQAGAWAFYNHVKGETEDRLRAIGFDALVIAQPSLLLGDRSALGQPPRRGERFASALLGALAPVLPARYRPIPAAQVAKALLRQMAVSPQPPLPRVTILAGDDLIVD